MNLNISDSLHRARTNLQLMGRNTENNPDLLAQSSTRGQPRGETDKRGGMDGRTEERRRLEKQ